MKSQIIPCIIGFLILCIISCKKEQTSTALRPPIPTGLPYAIISSHPDSLFIDKYGDSARIELDGSQSTDGEIKISEYQWDLIPVNDDYPRLRPSGPKASFDLVEGEYFISLKITDSLGRSRETQTIVTVYGPLTRGKWILSSAISVEAYDLDNDGTASVDLYSQMSDCAKREKWKFFPGPLASGPLDNATAPGQVFYMQTDSVGCRAGDLVDPTWAELEMYFRYGWKSPYTSITVDVEDFKVDEVN